MSLYRKYRPQTFEDVVGQDHVARTLRNALSATPPRVAHAYLFTGPRGIGKTTNARLMAKCLNCENGPTATPCNQCDFCVRVSNNQPTMDLIEMDAASHTGVENVRENIIEKAGMAPSQGRYRVYVIDECFRFEEPVTLADGSRLPIGKIVEEKLPVSVLSFNETTGQTEAKPVVRWMKKQPTMPVVRVTFNQNRSLVCTLSHKFYTPDGLLRAGELEEGQFVYADYERITQHQWETVAGAAIGDGHIALNPSGMRARLSMTQGVAQHEYLLYKTGLLGDLVAGPPVFQEGIGSYSTKGTYRVATLSRPHIAQLHRELYAEGRKRITAEFLQQLTPLGLALWYLDDGSLVTQANPYRRKDGTLTHYPATRSVFATYGFELDEARRIGDWLAEKWNIEGGVSATAKGPVIWLTLPGTKRLHELIAQYVPPSMQYKLLPQFRDEFEETGDDGTLAPLGVSIVKKVERVAAPPFVYNIEVADNHNYFARDILVANCHMLSSSSFNALLKTIEEPPPHLVFILATTETHKVPATITSRCQRFDFRRVGPADIAKRLHYVADSENFKLQDEAAKLIARHADGALRDALTLLEQVAAFSGEEITAADVRLVLGGVPQELLFAIMDGVAANDARGVLEIIERAVEEGASFQQFTRELVSYCRDLLLLTVGFAGDVGLSAGENEIRARHAQSFGRAKLESVLLALRDAEKEMRSSTDHRLLLELTLVRATESSFGAIPQVAAPVAAAPSGPQRPTLSSVPLARPKIEAPKIEEPKPEPKIEAPPVVEEVEAEPEPTPEPPEAEPQTPTHPDTETSKKKGRRISNFEELIELWPAVLMRVKKKVGVTAVAYLHDARPIGFDDEQITLEFTKEFHHAKAEEASGRLPFESVISEVLDKPRRLIFKFAPPAPKAPEPEPEAPPDDDDDEDADIIEWTQTVFAAEVVGRSGR